jgi:hypothetical protein
VPGAADDGSQPLAADQPGFGETDTRPNLPVMAGNPISRHVCQKRWICVPTMADQLCGRNTSSRNRLCYSPGALWQSASSNRFTFPLAELTRRTLISSLFWVPILLPCSDQVSKERLPTEKSASGRMGITRPN